MSLYRQLTRLEQANLIRLAASQPELEYMFRHALVQESAYHTLVRADRRRVHRAAGEALEALYAGREPPPDIALQLARHFEEAADEGRAIRYYTLAGDAAMARYANVEAVAAFSRALACAERSAPKAGRWQHLFTARGRALELNSQFTEALANYQAMGERASALGDRRLALTAVVAAGQLYATATPLFDPPQAERMAEAALAEARDLGDEVAEAKILWNQLNFCRLTQRNQAARVFGERSLGIARRLGLQEQAALTLNDLIHVYADLGLWPEARAASQEAGRQWRELGNLAMLADSLSTTALYGSLTGELASALSQAQEAHRLSLFIGNLWGQSYSLSAMGWPYWYTGHPDRAIETSNECIRVGRLAGYLVAEVFDRARLAYMMSELGDGDLALELTEQAEQATQYVGGVGLGTVLGARIRAQLRAGSLEQAAATLRTVDKEVKEPAVWEVDPILRARSEVALAEGDGARALAATQAHVARLSELGLVAPRVEALIGLAQALLLLDRVAEARERLVEAQARAQALGAIMIEWLALYHLGALETRHGSRGHGENYWAKARDIVTGIVARTPPELRQSFLARPELRALFDDSSPAANPPQAPARPAV